MTGQVPVVIVGAGPVGVTAATLLARRGIASVLLEKYQEPYPLPRAVHLDDEVARILQAAGVAEQFGKISRPMPGMRLVDAQHKTMAEFNRAGMVGPNGYPRANMFDQPELEQILLDNLAAHPLVTLRRGCEVTSIEGTGPVTVRYTQDGSEHQSTSGVLLGADGANSLVRQAIGSGLRDLRFEERWLVIDVRSPRALCDWGGVYQICDPARAATFMHVTGDRYRWEFRLADGETAGDLTAPGQLARLLKPWTPDIADLVIIRQATYTFRARVADRWRRGQVFLLGDAAHQTPPFIGQGLGAGLRDAANLSWKLAAVLHGQVGEEILDTYEQERRPHVTRTIRAAVTVGWALTGGQDRAAIIRRIALAGLCRLPGFSTAIADSASPRLTGSALIDRRLDSRDPAGRPCPQPDVLAGHDKVRLDTLLGDGWALLTRGPAAVPAGLRHVDISALDPVGTAQMREWLRRHRTHAVLVRPDRIIAATGRRALTFHLDNRNIDRMNDANTAEFTRAAMTVP
jgi:3-(3-hydroxy-phenyl)propionate hydroxylase